MESVYSKKKNKLESTFQSAPKEVKNEAPVLPNSLLLAMHGGSSENEGNPELENIMKSQLAAFRHQIPAAESEADQLSSGITSGTPEQVKQSMGERLGTDFSSVQFHTGESVSQRADNMGARAWTQGNDVYFGEGGFHPAVAAHELVHTVQQGAVDSSAVNVSAPMGGVQMSRLGDWFRRLITCGCCSPNARQTKPNGHGDRPIRNSVKGESKKYTKEDLKNIQKQIPPKTSGSQGQLLEAHYLDESESNDRDRKPDEQAQQDGQLNLINNYFGPEGVQQPTRQEQMEQRMKYAKEQEQKRQQILQQAKQPGQKKKEQKQKMMKVLARQVAQAQEEEITFELLQLIPDLEGSQSSGQRSQSSGMRRQITVMCEMLIEGEKWKLVEKYREMLRHLPNREEMSPLRDEIEALKNRMLDRAMHELQQREMAGRALRELEQSKMAEHALACGNEGEENVYQTTPVFPKEGDSDGNQTDQKEGNPNANRTGNAENMSLGFGSFTDSNWVSDGNQTGNAENMSLGFGSFGDSDWVSRSGHEPFTNQSEKTDSKRSGLVSFSESSVTGYNKRQTSVHKSDQRPYMGPNHELDIVLEHENEYKESPQQRKESSESNYMGENGNSFRESDRVGSEEDSQIQLAIEQSLLENKKKSNSHLEEEFKEPYEESFEKLRRNSNESNHPEEESKEPYEESNEKADYDEQQLQLAIQQSLMEKNEKSKLFELEGEEFNEQKPMEMGENPENEKANEDPILEFIRENKSKKNSKKRDYIGGMNDNNDDDYSNW